MKAIPLRPFLVSVPYILAFFLPGACLAGLFRAWFLTLPGHPYDRTVLATLVYESGVIVAFCVWQGIRVSWKRRDYSRKEKAAEKAFRWLVVPWSFLLSLCLSLLYLTCYAIALFIMGKIMRGNAMPISLFRFVAAWLPDVRETGIIMFWQIVVGMQMLTTTAFFVTAFVSYIILYKRIQSNNR